MLAMMVQVGLEFHEVLHRLSHWLPGESFKDTQASMVTAFSTHLHDDELARSHNDPKKACLFLAQFWMDEQVVTLSSKFI